jgi:hypothetical protein
MNLLPHIEQKTYIWTDACASYNRLIKELTSDSKVVSSKRDYDKVNHLNNVNSFWIIPPFSSPESGNNSSVESGYSSAVWPVSEISPVERFIGD